MTGTLLARPGENFQRIRSKSIEWNQYDNIQGCAKLAFLPRPGSGYHALSASLVGSGSARSLLADIFTLLRIAWYETYAGFAANVARSAGPDSLSKADMNAGGIPTGSHRIGSGAALEHDGLMQQSRYLYRGKSQLISSVFSTSRFTQTNWPFEIPVKERTR